MDSDFPYSKFKIIFLNTFSILYRAATLNPYRLQSELREIKSVLQNSSDEILLPHILIIFISLLLMAKFLLGYVSLAANIIAIFPILSGERPELLLPAIVSQATENVMLTFIEIILGYVTCKYYITGKMSLFAIFFVKMAIKMSISVSTLNVYSDLYSELKYSSMYKPSVTKDDSSVQVHISEEFINKQTLK